MPYSSSAYARLLFQLLFQERSGIALRFLLYHLFRGAGKQDLTAFTAAFGAHVEDAVSHLDHVEVVLDHEHRVSCVDEALEHLDELAHVLEVQARGGLIEDVEGLSRLLTVQLLGELDALRLAARERGRRLAQVDVAQAHVVQGLELVLDLRDVRKEGQGFRDRHVEHVADGLAVVGDLERLAVVPLSVTHLAGHVHVRQEVHLDLYLAVALAGLAAAAGHVEREAPRPVAAHAALRRGSEQRAQVVPQADVGRGVASRGAADGALVDVDDLVDEVDALEFLVRADGSLGAVHRVGEGGRQRVGDERRLAGARDARDHGERAELNLGVDALEVVRRGARDLYGAAARVAALGRKSDLLFAREVGARDGVGAGGDLVRRARRNHVPAELAGAGAHVDDVVGGADGVLVVLDDDHGVACL